MSAESNAQLVTTAWKELIGGRLDDFLARLSDEISWVIPGNLKGISGLLRGKDAVRKFASGIGKSFPNGLNCEVRKVHTAGDGVVVIETTNSGKAWNGKDYRNEYCFIFEIEAGKIRRIREYVDMLTVKETLLS